MTDLEAIGAALTRAVAAYLGDDARRIDHACRVTGYALELLEPEGGDYTVVVGAGMLHDIGIHEAEKKYGSAAGIYQEREGPPIARRILGELGFAPGQTDEICEIIAHHHSPGKITTRNFKILYDADWLVNLGDEYDIRDRHKLAAIIGRVFLTETGKAKARGIYLDQEKTGLVGNKPQGRKTMATKTKLDPIVEFREDHRKVRDGLLDLAAAAEAGDVGKAGKILGQIDAMVGPHFRYEEETLYPSLREFLGDYVDSLVSEHDGAIDTAKTAARLLSLPSLSKEEGKAVSKAARALLVHVSNCDGLNILAERLSKEKLDELSERYAKSRAAGVPLLKWADTIRKGRR